LRSDSRRGAWRAFVLKSHYICTADRATLVNQIVPEVQAFGAIALNNSVGGLNPLALDIAGRLGTRVCWLPSVDNANELEAIAGQRDETKLPYWMSIAREMRALGIAGSFLNVTEDGQVTQATRQCLEIIAKHDMVLATSHIRPAEVLPVVKAAQELGVKRIIITHPEFPTTLLSIPQQQELARYGVFFERCFTTPNTGKIRLGAGLREYPRGRTGKHDPGKPTWARPRRRIPTKGWARSFRTCSENGFRESEVQAMVRDNPAQVLGARTARRSAQRTHKNKQGVGPERNPDRPRTFEVVRPVQSRRRRRPRRERARHHVFIGPNGAGKMTSPADGRSAAKHIKTVDLPAPFGPINTWMSCSLTSRSTPSTALNGPYDFESPRAVRLRSGRHPVCSYECVAPTAAAVRAPSTWAGCRAPWPAPLTRGSRSRAGSK